MIKPLPRFHLQPPVPPRLAQQIHDEMGAGQYPVVRYTLAEFEQAISQDRGNGRSDLGLREWGWPTGSFPGRRWYTRPPRCWEAWCYEMMIAPCYLVEITGLEVPDKPDHLIVYRWRVEIEGEDAVQAILRALGEKGTYAALKSRQRLAEWVERERAKVIA